MGRVDQDISGVMGQSGHTGIALTLYMLRELFSLMIGSDQGGMCISIVQRDNMIGPEFFQIGRVRRENDSASLIGQSLQDLKNMGSLFMVQESVKFIYKQHARLRKQGAGELQKTFFREIQL